LYGKWKIFLTYNRHLRNFSERLYRGLSTLTEIEDPNPPLFLTFKDLCRQLVPNVDRRFPTEREVDVFGFKQLLRKQARSEKFDYALLWEEIRSIIKGAKPQINTDRFEALISQLKKFGSNASTLRDLREELLALRYLNLYEQIERILSKQLKQGLQQVVIELEELCENRPAQLVRALETVQKRVRKRDASLHTPFMSFAEYEQLGRKRAPNFLHSRQDIHAIAVWYQEQLQKQGMWDEVDLTRAALQSMERSPEQEHRFEFVACDEVQDFTNIQLSLIFRLVADPRHLLLAGDPKQIINPSGFRWEEVRQMFYDRHLDVPGVHHLTLNFRCVGSIVLLANSLLRLKQRLLGMQRHEKLDQWKYQGRLPCLVESIPAQTLLQQVRMTGADRIILTRTESERDHLKKELATELVMTIREAKGLEFGTVLLWRFASEAEDVWDTIIRNSARGLHEALIRHEINLLYVGITRARHNLIVYDGSRASVIWKAEGLRDHVFRTHDLQYLAQAWQVPSSREEWKDQGDYYLQHERYRAAAECYGNAEQSELMYRALARAAEEKRDFLVAAEHWWKTGEQHRAAASYEHAEEFGQAREIWLQLGDEQGATRCQLRLLESQGKYGEIAEYWEAQGVVDKAIHYWQKSKRPDRLAPLFETQKNHCMAAKAYEDAGAFEQAARLFKKSKMHAEAARCHENAGQWESALRIWAKLKRDDDIIRCLTRLDDPIRLAAFFEKRKEWEKALQTYQRGWNEALRAQAEQDLQSIRPRGQAHARRAIRFVLLDRLKEAAAAWEKARHYGLAGLYYEEVKEYHLAGRCFEKTGEWLSAIKMYVQSPQEQYGRYVSVRRCVRKALLQGGAKLFKPELEHCALRFAGQGCYEAASWILEVLEEKSEAALFAAMAGQVRRSLRLFDRFESFQKAAATFSRFG
ncbi:UvrD-helicase domain-containing protein, partial [Acidobacteria bacterium AH-259-G07]|nr:UvrD-helicase domain-containing protein [Acidobacteria bacterium AH-259-G07]